MTLKRILAAMLVIVITNNLLGQKVEFFKNIQFDSSYSVIGTFSDVYSSTDTSSYTGFLIDNIDDLLKLKREWVFDKPVSKLNMETNAIEIFTVQDKHAILELTGLIYTTQGVINNSGNWYPIDMDKYKNFFRLHKIQYHSKLISFDKYSDYSAYGNKQLSDSTFLFYLEPTVSKFEGSFTLTADRRSDPASPFSIIDALSRELSQTNNIKDYNLSVLMDDGFTPVRAKIKVTVNCSKKIFDAYHNKRYEKGEWTKPPIQARFYWRD